MKHLTHTHPLEQSIRIDEDVDPTVAIRLDPMTIGITMGDVPMIMAIAWICAWVFTCQGQICTAYCSTFGPNMRILYM